MEADPTLLDDVKKMNADALARSFELFASALYNYALRFSRDSVIADNVVGDVFAKLLDHLSVGNGPKSNLRAYLFEIAYHILVDESRYSNRRAPIEAVESSLGDGYSTYVSVENRMLFETVLWAIENDLTEDQRDVIILRYLEGFSLKETAIIIGKSVASVKMTQSRAILRMRRRIEPEAGTLSSMYPALESVMSY
jgi:RNA polymerase sigma-70 factor (ECF subfamily)